MYHALVPIDGNEERVVAQADAVRRLPNADDSVHVTVLHVASEQGQTDEAIESATEKISEVLADYGIEMETQKRVGNPATAILEAAEDTGADMIVMGGRKRSPLGSLLFGSVSQSVMLDADRPVTITGSEVKRDPTHRCEDCGRTYYLEHDVEIDTCRQCGGVHVERVGQVPAQ